VATEPGTPKSPNDETPNQQIAALAVPLIVQQVAAFLGMSIAATWAWWQSLSDNQKKGIILKMEEDGEIDEELEKRCAYLHYKVDIPTCKRISKKGGMPLDKGAIVLRMIDMELA